MKILLLSDIPPCDNLTAGLVLSAMVRLVPRDAICCFAVVNPTLDLRLSTEFANIPMEIHNKPNESWAWLPRRRLVRKISSGVGLVGETLTELTIVRGLIDKAVEFGRDQKVDRVWAVLQGQTTIRMAKAVADELGVPLHTHVWDPFSWWASANHIDGVTTRRVQAMFDEAIRGSKCVATASEPMADLYHERFKVAAVPVISSHPSSMGQSPDFWREDERPILIGMAGQFYAASEWLQLVRALKASGWRISGRDVRIVVMGPQRPPGAADEHISHLGWKSQPDAAFILSQCDLLYCPYPFDAGMSEVSRYSFPSKLVLYLAAGRPIVFHGPDYSSPAKYIRSRQCGLIANRPHATAIYNDLERLVGNFEAYKTMAHNAQLAFQSDFTLKSMERSFSTFIGQPLPEEEAETRLHDHTGGSSVTASDLFSGRGSAIRSMRTTAQKSLVRYRMGRDAVRSSVRKAALRIPRLHALYTEIRALEADKRQLSQQVSLLRSENERLKHLLQNHLRDESDESAFQVMAGRTAQISSLRVPTSFFDGLHPETRNLVLAKWQDSTPPVDNTAASGSTIYLADASIAYASLPSLDASASAFAEHQLEHYSVLEREAIGRLLRNILGGGFSRLIVASEKSHEIAFAALLARLASMKLTVVVDAPSSDNHALSHSMDLDVVYARPA